MNDSRDKTLCIQLFNGPRVRVGSEEAASFPTRHAAAILTLLALAADHRIARDEIADTLWPDEALDASRRRIREHLYQLRKTIPNGHELIVSERDSIQQKLTDAPQYSHQEAGPNTESITLSPSHPLTPSRLTTPLLKVDVF